MHASIATQAGTPEGRNDDWAAVTTHGVAVVLDGLSEGVATGCRHGTGWYVQQLGCRLMTHSGDLALTLPQALGRAIDEVAGSHADRCDLAHPGSPGATVAVVRHRGVEVDYLVLADAVVVLDRGGTDDAQPLVVTDDRVRAHTPAGADLAQAIEAQHAVRNTPGGYWVAQVDPAAAGHALTGTVSGTRGALLLSDGAALAVTDFAALTWAELLKLGYERGPGELIAVTHELAARDPDRLVWPRLKRHDDATAIVCRW